MHYTKEPVLFEWENIRDNNRIMLKATRESLGGNNSIMPINCSSKAVFKIAHM